MKEFTFNQNVVEPNLERLHPNGLRLAIPSRGELVEGARAFLTAQGIDTARLFGETRELSITTKGDITVFKLRAPDIIDAFRRRALDVAILGTDVLFEAASAPNPPNLTIDRILGFGACDFCVGFPLNATPIGFTEIKSVLETKPIVTSLPCTLRRLLQNEQIYVSPAQIIEMTGGIESGVRLYNAGAVADRASSGSTMMANNIRKDLTLIKFRGAALVFRKDFIESGKYYERR